MTVPVRQLLDDADWASTPLGPRASWPRELEDTLRFLLEIRQPMVVWWGPRYTLLYNDAFVPSAGDRHPGGFARPLDEGWPEVAEHISRDLTDIERGDSNGMFREDDLLLLERTGGRPEETYWQYSTTPVRGASGDVLGLITMCNETTGKVVGARRMRLLASLGEITRDAPSVDVVVQRLVALLEPAQDVPFAAFVDPRGGSAPVTVGMAEPPAGWVPLERETGTDPVQFRAVDPTPVDDGPEIRHVVRALLRTPDGSLERGVVLGAAPLLPLDDDHRTFLRMVIGHVGTALTVAAAQEADRTLRDVRARHEEVRSGYYAALGDEFRTPLTLVLGPLDRLREHADPAVRDEVELAQRNAQRMLKLVNGLLDVSSLNSGLSDGMFAPTELGATTAELAAAFEPVTDRAGLSLDVRCQRTERPVWVDRDMWEKIVLNLLSNAVKFTHDGGITVALELSGEQAVLRVTDTGSGIPADRVDQVFERFRRVRDARARSQEGSGLGLSLVQQLVRMHGGSVDVTSTVGVGSTFTVRIPIGFAHLPSERLVRSGVGTRTMPALAGPYVAEALRWMPDRDGHRSGRAAPALGVGGLGVEGLEHKDRVLVVDDDPDMRAYLQHLLSERWTPQVVTNGTEALDAARAAPPDLVVTDVSLPGLDGIGLLRALRTDPRTAGVPVVLLSSRAGEEAAVEGLAAGADDYLVKPFSSRELLARVANHLQLGRVRRAAELQFRAMADSTPALIWVDDPGGHRVFVNRGWLDFTGASEPAGELGLDWRRRIHPEDRERYRSVTSAAARSAAPFEVEYRLLDGNGRYRWVLDRGAPVGEADRSAGYVGGCLDIDAQHREQRRHRIYSEVGESLERAITRTGRTDQLARAVVDEGLADVALVHEGVPGTAGAAPLAAAASRSALEPALWDLGPLVPDTGPIEHQPIETDRLRAVLAALPDAQRAAWERVRVRAALVVPLPARGRTGARLTVARCDPGDDYTADDLDLVSEIGRRAGLAVDNARLLEQERATAQRLGLLHRATARMSAAATAGDVAAIAADHIVDLLDADYAGVWELRGPWLRALTGHGWDDDLWRRAGNVRADAPFAFGDVLRERVPLWYPSAADWAERYPAQVGLVPDGAESVGYLPLVAGGRALGVLAVGFTRERVLSGPEREAAAAVAELAAQALDRASMLEVETEARRLAERLGAIATALSRATDLESVAEVIVEHVRSAVDAEAVVLLVLGENGLLGAIAEDGWPPAPDGAVQRLGHTHPLTRSVATGEALWNAATPEAARYPVQTAVPLMVAARPIGVLGFRFAVEPAFTAEQRSFVLTLANQCAQAIMRARLHQAEHEVAVTLQRSLLPQKLPELDRMSLATRYRPGTEGTEAGGDWFDVLALDDGKVALVVGDVVGHGPSAAAVMGQLRSAVAANLVNGQSPAGALEQLDQFALRVSGAMASTVACAVVNCATGELCYASAGHPPPLLAGPNGVRMLDKGRGVPLGITGRPPFTEDSDHIEPGQTILLCSDGLFERRDEVIDDGLARLSAAFGELSAAQPRDMADALLSRMSEGSAIPDDTVVLVARLMPPPLEIVMDADPTRLAPLRRTVDAWCDACGMGQDAHSDLQLTVGEAVTNAIEHAYLSGPVPGGRTVVDVAMRLRPDGAVAVSVADHGRWRPPPADPGYRGRGIALIRELAEEVTVEPSPDGTRVRFRLPSIPVEVGTPGAGPPVEFVAGEAEPARPAEPDGRPDGPTGGPAGGTAGGPTGGTAGGPTGGTTGGTDEPPVVADRTRLRTTPDRDGVRITVVGDLDLGGVAAIRASLFDLLAHRRQVTLSLGRDSFVSSAGIALLSEVARRTRTGGAALFLVAPAGSQARRALVLSGLDSVIGLSDDG